MFAPGNHDVGLDSGAYASVDVTPSGPFYMVYFPQHTVATVDKDTGLSVDSLPELKDRKTYHHHRVGKLLFMMLDSGMAETYDGQMLDWMN